jgi:dissimilatory sulfite reductase (desulfoviridin) alpha/beta subunit
MIARGNEIFPIIEDKETLFRIADAALDFFQEHAKSGERFRVSVDRAGWDTFKTAMEKAYIGKTHHA